VKCCLSESNDLVLGSVYFPYRTGTVDYIIELEDTVGCLQGIMDIYNSCRLILAGTLICVTLLLIVIKRLFISCTSSSSSGGVF